jgi:hypothetical protein
MNIDGLKIIRTTNPIYRADKEYSRIGGIASNIYEDAPIKYFTLNESELSAYTKYGMPYKKTWEPTEELVLIDILHKPTREKLAELIGTESLNIAFPINENKVSRVSEEDTKIHDDNVLKAICSLNPLIDGYYMDKITKRVKNNNGVNGNGVNSNGINVNKTIFHSEVGLCSKAFNKIKLIDSKKSNNAPAINRKRTKRNNNNNRNITNKNRNKNNNMVNNPLSHSKRLFND